MNRWNTTKVGEVSELINGYAFKSNEFVDSGVPILKIKSVKPHGLVLNELDFVKEELAATKQKFRAKNGDILITMSGNRADGSPESWVGKVCQFRLPDTEQYLVNQRVGILRGKPDVTDNTFLAYLLGSWDFQQHFISQANSSGGQANISPDIIKNAEIILPPLPEQRAIAEVLSSLDDKIDLLHRNNKTLEEMAETLFRQWFVVEAKEEWASCSLSSAIKLVGGGTPKTSISEYWDGSIPWLSGGDITNNHKGFAISAEKTITELGLDNSSAKLLPKFATVISARGTVGKYCLLNSAMTFSQSNYGVLPVIKDTYFFTYLLLAHSVDELLTSAYGSVFDTITTATFEGVNIGLPSEKEIIDFDNRVKPIFYKIAANVIQLQTLSKTRDVLLPKLMSGQVRVNL